MCQWKFNEKVGFYSAWKLFIALCSLEQILIGLIPWHWEKVRFQMGIGRLCDSEDFFFVRCVLGALKYQHKTRNQHGDKSWGWGWVGAFSMSIADPYQTCWARPFQIPGSSDAEISHAWELSLNSWWDNEQGLFSFLARSHQLCPPLNLSHFRSKSAGLNHLFPDFVPWEPLPELLVFPRHMILKQEHIASQGWVRGCSSQL